MALPSTHSIARRLALMFSVAAACVFGLAGLALYKMQRAELHRHLQQELDTRYQYVHSLLVRYIGSTEKWPNLVSRLNDLAPPGGKVRYVIEGPDPRFRYGVPFAEGAVVRDDEGVLRIVEPNHSYFAQIGDAEAFGERPTVKLSVAVDPVDFDTSTAKLGITLLASLGLGVVVVGALGWWIARRNLAPVDDLSNAARYLRPQNLAERLPATNLPCELVGLVLSFNGALDRVEQAYQQLYSFSADVAHELRTPLGNLIGQTQVMLSRERPVVELEDTLHSNLEELERLRIIVNDMLFLAQADRGVRAAHAMRVSLAEQIRRSAEFLDVLFEEAGVELSIEGDAAAAIDPSLFARAVTNLLHNAIQYGLPGSVIHVVIKSLDEGVEISISNKGEPIPSGHIDRLFDRFYRIDPARTDSGANHGLGLAIVKAIAVMHGGHVFARSKDGVNIIGFTIASEARI
ncbi:MAG TPA: heavy metal sensor histidine kinase [Rhodocyclaceae bacterium]|nr:heavy metal sensor histidine kinase [Rhodocyclaceae bacterium]